MADQDTPTTDPANGDDSTTSASQPGAQSDENDQSTTPASDDENSKDEAEYLALQERLKQSYDKLANSTRDNKHLQDRVDQLERQVAQSSNTDDTPTDDPFAETPLDIYSELTDVSKVTPETQIILKRQHEELNRMKGATREQIAAIKEQAQKEIAEIKRNKEVDEQYEQYRNAWNLPREDFDLISKARAEGKHWEADQYLDLARRKHQAEKQNLADAQREENMQGSFSPTGSSNGNMQLESKTEDFHKAEIEKLKEMSSDDRTAYIAEHFLGYDDILQEKVSRLPK